MEDSIIHQALIGELLALHKEFIWNSWKVNFCQEVKNGLRTLTLSIQLPDNATSTIKKRKKISVPEKQRKGQIKGVDWEKECLIQKV